MNDHNQLAAAQLEARKRCDENQETHFRLGQSPVVGQYREQSGHAICARKPQCLSCHPEIASNLRGERISMLTTIAGIK